MSTGRRPSSRAVFPTRSRRSRASPTTTAGAGCASGAELFRSIDPQRWELCLQNPVRLLQEVTASTLRRAAGDGALIERAALAELALRAEVARPASRDGLESALPVAFFCAEYGIHARCRSTQVGWARSRGISSRRRLTARCRWSAVGLMYRQGYFRQRIDAGGWQHEYWVETDPERLPAALVAGRGRRGHRIAVPIGNRQATAQVWRVDVGRVPLFLLDVDRPENDRRVRWISSRLYVGDAQTRLAQYVLLGVGGVRALRALGVEPGDDSHERGPRGAGPARAGAGGAGAGRGAGRRTASWPARERSSPPTHPCRPATTPTRPTRPAPRSGRSPTGSPPQAATCWRLPVRRPTTRRAVRGHRSSRSGRAAPRTASAGCMAQVARAMWRDSGATGSRRRCRSAT